MSGTLDGSFKRKYTGKSNWDEAEWGKAGSWDGMPALLAPEIAVGQSPASLFLRKLAGGGAMQQLVRPLLQQIIRDNAGRAVRP